MSVYFEEHVVTHESIDDNDNNHVIHLIDFNDPDRRAFCGSLSFFHDLSCPGYLEEWGEETECPYCKMPICPDCIFIDGLDREFDV